MRKYKARMGKIGVYSEKTRKMQRKLSFESFGHSFKEAKFFLYQGPVESANINDIADKVLFEVPDRLYAECPVCIPIGVEPDMEAAMDFSRFGLINPMTTEKTYRVHIDDFETLGREVVVGDVFELPFFSKNGKRALFEVADVDLKLEYEQYIAIIKAAPLTKSRTTVGIDMNRDTEFQMSTLMDDAEAQWSDIVPSDNLVFEPEDIVPNEVDYRNKVHTSFLDDPTAVFNK